MALSFGDQRSYILIGPRMSNFLFYTLRDMCSNILRLWSNRAQIYITWSNRPLGQGWQSKCSRVVGIPLIESERKPQMLKFPQLKIQSSSKCLSSLGRKTRGQWTGLLLINLASLMCHIYWPRNEQLSVVYTERHV